MGDEFTAATASPPDFEGLIESVRRASQQGLVAAAKGRAEADARVNRAVTMAREESERFEPDRALLARFREAWRTYGTGETQPVSETPESLEQARAWWQRAAHDCDEALAAFRLARDDYEAGQRKIFGRKPPMPSLEVSFAAALSRLEAVAEAVPTLRDHAIRTATERATSEVATGLKESHHHREAELRRISDSARADAALGLALVGNAALDWNSFLEAQSETNGGRTWLRLGEFDSGLPTGTLPRLPCLVTFPLTRGLAIFESADSVSESLSLARSVVLRALASAPPGALLISIVDPVALGQSLAEVLHLGDYDERLIDTKPWTSAQDIEVKLAELTAHLETVIAKYLRGQHASIDEYNAEAGEMAEPYRLLVVFDFPTGFSERAEAQLLSIVENGPRCGVQTLIVVDSGARESHEPAVRRLLSSMDVISWVGDGRFRIEGGGRRSTGLDVVSDVCPDIIFSSDGSPVSAAARLLARIGISARAAEHEVVGYDRALPVLNRLVHSGLAERLPQVRSPGEFDHRDPESWWRGDSSSSVVAPIGRAGAQGIASLYFSSTEIAGGALIVGLPRSGKTTALHAAILSMCMIYGPDELELYLIDAKHGVEFSGYAHLPHARMVAINREREFAVAVLQSLDDEIARRADLMKSETPGRTNLEEYRRATGKALPRIVAIIDEFHEIFEEDDRLGQAAFAAFSSIVRQGPFAGVHVVLASQTLSAMPAMDRSTLTLLPGRVAFVCNDSDADIVMGDTNPDVRFLSRAGEGLLNQRRGDPAHNQRFQGIYISPDERARLVRHLSEQAVRAGFGLRLTSR